MLPPEHERPEITQKSPERQLKSGKSSFHQTSMTWGEKSMNFSRVFLARRNHSGLGICRTSCPDGDGMDSLIYSFVKALRIIGPSEQRGGVSLTLFLQGSSDCDPLPSR